MPVQHFSHLFHHTSELCFAIPEYETHVKCIEASAFGLAQIKYHVQFIQIFITV